MVHIHDEHRRSHVISLEENVEKMFLSKILEFLIWFNDRWLQRNTSLLSNKISLTKDF